MSDLRPKIPFNSSVVRPSEKQAVHLQGFMASLQNEIISIIAEYVEISDQKPLQLVPRRFRGLMKFTPILTEL